MSTSLKKPQAKINYQLHQFPNGDQFVTIKNKAFIPFIGGVLIIYKDHPEVGHIINNSWYE